MCSPTVDRKLIAVCLMSWWKGLLSLLAKAWELRARINRNFFLVSGPQSLVQVPVTQTTHVAVHESTPKFELDLAYTEVLPMSWLLSLQLHWQPEQPKSSPKTHFIKHSLFHVSGKISREGLLLKEEESWEMCSFVHFQDYNCSLHYIVLEYISYLKSSLTLDISQIVYLR